MKVKQMITLSLFALVALALVKFGPLAWLFTAGLRAPAQAPAPDYWPTDGWRSSSPEEQGFDSAKLAAGLQALQDRQVDIDSLLLIRNGYVVLDAHFAPYDGSFPHDLASVTKSVMTTLIAIAADQGYIDLDQPVVSYFPGRTIANLDERKARLTVRHLTGMVNGMESGCFEGDDPTLQAMRSHPDWVQAALDRPMVAEPGSEFCYDSPGMHLLSAILQETTGMTALDFARRNLFAPLGIQDAKWEVDPQGYSRGWGDLHLLPEDLAKIGFLWLHRGNWNGQQIVSEDWVLDSVRPHSKFIEPDFGYGYGWWVSPADYQASGRGGQRVRVIASLNTLLVITAEDYDYAEIEAWLTPALLEAKTTRPANLEGQAKLQAVLASLAQQPVEWYAGYSPDAARLVSGKTYRCENNPAGIEAIRMVFDDPAQAMIFILTGGSEKAFPVGLDGKYRQQQDEGLSLRGYWQDAQTLYFEEFDIGVVGRQAHFEGDNLQISFLQEGLEVACQVENP